MSRRCCSYCVLLALRSGAVRIRKRGLSEPYQNACALGLCTGGACLCVSSQEQKSSLRSGQTIATGGGAIKALVKVDQCLACWQCCLDAGLRNCVGARLRTGKPKDCVLLRTNPPQNRPSVNCRTCCTGPSALLAHMPCWAFVDAPPCVLSM